MAVIVTASVTIKPDKVAEAIAFMKERLPDTRSADGCQFLEVSEDKDRPEVLLSYSRWDSIEHYETYTAWRTETGVMAAFGEFVAEPPVTTFYETIDL